MATGREQTRNYAGAWEACHSCPPPGGGGQDEGFTRGARETLDFVAGSAGAREALLSGLGALIDPAPPPPSPQRVGGCAGFYARERFIVRPLDDVCP